MHIVNNICRCLLKRGFGDSYVGSGDCVAFMYFDELGQRLGKHGTAGLKRISSLCEKDVRRGNGRICPEGAGGYLYALQIRDIESTGFVGHRWEVVGSRAALFLQLRLDPIVCKSYVVILT